MQQEAEIASAPTEKSKARPIPADASALIFFNAKAGSVREGDRDKLIEALHAVGVNECTFVGVEHLSKHALRRAKNFDVIIVLGGDGTARSVAELIPRDAPPLLLLPGGTMNILPRALLGERAWPEALTEALERGTVKRLAAARANGTPFYVAAIFGAPTLLARAREAVREGKLWVAVKRLRVFMNRAFSRSLRARPGEEPMRKAEAVGVLCPSFTGNVDGDDVEWVSLDAKHLLDLARVSLRGLSEAWRNDPAVEIGRCKQGDILSLGIIPAVLDGEPRTFVSRVRVTYDRNGPRVLTIED